MSTATIPSQTVDAPPPVPVYRFTLEEYRRLAEAGILTDDHRVELLEGWIVPKMTHNLPHDGAIQLVADALRRLLPPNWCDRIQSTVQTPDSEPEPDVAVVRGDVRTYCSRHPGPGDVGVIVEVAEASLQRDREIKQRIYARARIPCYWIINVIDGQIEVYTDPSDAGDRPYYRQRRILKAGDAVPVVLDGREVAEIAVSDLLP